MGAPTGSADVRSVIWPCDSGFFCFSSAKPVIDTVAGPSTEFLRIAAQVFASGVQVWPCASSGVSAGGGAGPYLDSGCEDLGGDSQELRRGTRNRVDYGFRG